MKYTIIGAGIGGLATALAFEQKGIEYAIYEKSPQLNEVGAGIWLAPNALQVIDTLGLLKEIQSKGNAIKRMTLGLADLSPLSDMPLTKVQEKYGFSTVAIHRAKLQSTLYNNIPAHKIHLGKAFQSFEQKDDQITVQFDDGTSTKSDYLIGADGIHSLIRKQIFPNSQIRYSGQTCWRGIADIAIDQEFEHRGFELWGDQIRFGVSRISADKVYWFALALSAPNLKDDTSLIKDKLLKCFSAFHPVVNKVISATSIDRILRNDIIDLKPMTMWYKGNVCLIGDAGHATTPNMGQGAAQAIEDAHYLSELIQLHPEENVFSRFHQQRKQKVNAIVSESWMTGKLAHMKYGRGIRNFVMQKMPNSIMERKMSKMYELKKII